MRKYLIIGILFVIASLSLIFYNEARINKINKQLVNLHSITNTGKKEEGTLVYLNTTFLGGNIIDDYYVFFGDGVQYIVRINEKEANRINDYLMDNPESYYKIRGTTKLISNVLEEPGKKFVKKWLDINHNHHDVEEENHSHDITTEEFYQYFGYVYLDYMNIYNNEFIKVLIYLTGIIGVLVIFKGINQKYNIL